MDCGSTGTAAGIDPKILDNWQTEGAYSVASWEHLGYDQPPEWDTSQESSQCDADIADLGTFQGPLNEYRRLERKRDVAPENLSYIDGVPVEGTGSGTISPKTIPSSADENFHSDEAWPHFQLYNSVGMPMDASLLYPYAKGPNPATGAVIVDDVGEMPHGGFPDAPAEGIMSFQQIPHSFPMIPEQWAEIQHSLPAENMPPPDAIPIATKTQGSPKNHSLHQFQTSIRSLESRWLNSLESQLPIPQIAPQNVGNNASMGQEFQFKSENSSVSGDLSGIYECSYSATSEDAPAFADRQLSDDDTQWKMSPHEPSSREGSQPAPKTTAFMVSEVPESMAAGGSRSRASSTAGRGGRPNALAMQSTATVRKRKTRNPGSSIDHGVRPLQIVQEDGQGGSIASADFVSPPRGARRKGPLSMVGRANAGLRRKNKDTCVQCRLNKRKCDGSSPCDACRPTLHEQPCARACFSSIVEFGTCNYICTSSPLLSFHDPSSSLLAQRAVNHPTMDGSNRVRMEIPSEFDLGQLLSLLAERQGRFNIRASQAWGSLYVLDLGETYKFLKNLSEYNGNSKSTFLEFIDRRIVDSKDKSKNWLSCVADCDPMNQAYTLLSQWNNMPSRAKYSFVSLDDSPERTMDINNPSDRREILLAAQLSRIFCRMLEVEGFRKLERDFYNIKWKQISHETHLRFLNELGHILLTLRWRVSWWKRLGDGGKSPDPTQQHYIDRVELLCRILYVYYTCVQAKLPSWSAAEVPKGKWSTYADSETVWDDFPSDSSDGGFQGWMDRGQDLIEAAGVPGRVSKF
ncbi:unnamed protein product [Penicillium salamii]|uniref:Zn(2)-C6 fungal-type domain-containing protein n=1 Tax=Penicillium salamii TaxID=1612424 RepID=A0A9W4NZ77_9EURO|nr:unnamed protein product [Penicillium salamii]CAG8106741.1 unnamed protein product [Penicillium salamii]CAG8184994.1 unnamed protein product [Penicillium salamii]CAG8196822.1 unnamed protein product [Penicillium salamii]CAG8203582.1 unnamed protein product [Penicillium salamii]